MLGIFLKILAILGWILLAVLAFVLLLLLLILFCPVRYRLRWEREGDKMTARVRAWWLFGFLKVGYAYPVPGNITAKLLWFSVFDSSRTPKKRPKAPKKEQMASEETLGEPQKKNQETSAGVSAEPEKTDRKSTAKVSGEPEKKGREASERVSGAAKNRLDQVKRLFAFMRKEELKQLLPEAFAGIGKILRSVRPRKIKGELLAGTGSPDTTGYLMAIYGILSPYLRNHYYSKGNFLLKPDFENKVLEGKIYAAGHATGAVLLFYVLRLAFDERLRSLINEDRGAKRRNVERRSTAAENA